MNYQEPKAEIIELELLDIICTSPEDGGGGEKSTEDDEDDNT